MCILSDSTLPERQCDGNFDLLKLFQSITDSSEISTVKLFCDYRKFASTNKSQLEPLLTIYRLLMIEKLDVTLTFWGKVDFLISKTILATLL